MRNETIVFVVNTLAVGGAAKVISFVANTATNVFKNVYVMVYDNKKPAHKLDAKIKVIHIKLNRGKRKKSIPFVSSIVNRGRWIKAIRHNIKSLEPDVVMPFITDVIIDTYIAMIGYKATYLAAERGDPTSYPLIWKVLSKAIYPFYNGIVFQTEGARQCFGQNIKKKSMIIENPYFDEEEDLNQRQRSSNRYIVSAGRFVPEKGFDNLIRAFKIINSKYPDYKLVIYGEGYLELYLKELISNLEMEKVVELKGYVKNVVKKISNCEIFVLSSLSEGIPNILIEAMAMGMPVVSTDCKPGGAASLIQDGENGLIVPISDSNKLAEAIEQLISDKKYANELGNEALRIKEKLNPKKNSRKWADFFNLF